MLAHAPSTSNRQSRRPIGQRERRQVADNERRGAERGECRVVRAVSLDFGVGMSPGIPRKSPAASLPGERRPGGQGKALSAGVEAGKNGTGAAAPRGPDVCRGSVRGRDLHPLCPALCTSSRAPASTTLLHPRAARKTRLFRKPLVRVPSLAPQAHPLGVACRSIDPPEILSGCDAASSPSSRRDCLPGLPPAVLRDFTGWNRIGPQGRVSGIPASIRRRR